MRTPPPRKYSIEERQRWDAKWAEMAASFPSPSPEVQARRAREQRVEREYKQARQFRKRLQRTIGRLGNRSRIKQEPPFGHDPKWTPHSEEPDWYTPMYPELYTSDEQGLRELKADHKQGHPMFPAAEGRAVSCCPNCTAHVYKTRRRKELKRDIVAWLGASCYLCSDRDVLDPSFYLVNLWGRPSSIGRRLHHSAADLQAEVIRDYVLLCPACYHDKGRKAVYQKARQDAPGLAHPPPRQGRRPRPQPHPKQP